MIVASVIPRLSCFVTDNAPRDAFVAALLSVLSVSLSFSAGDYFLFRKRESAV